MILSYRELALAGVISQRLSLDLLEQPGRVTSTPHLQPLRDSRQGHGRLAAQLHRQAHLAGIAFGPRRKLLLAPLQLLETPLDPPLRLRLRPCLHRLAEMARPGPLL